jgi:hypothetical protein
MARHLKRASGAVERVAWSIESHRAGEIAPSGLVITSPATPGALAEMTMNPRGPRRADATPRGSPLERPIEPAASAPPIVFVIDDDESMRRALERLLRSDGLQVEALGAASDFIARPLPDRPACVVLDLRNPCRNKF